jgi:putative two-component system response regulator
MQVLIVDDDEFALDFLDGVLTRMGYSVARAADGAEALDVLNRHEIRLVITDWEMPRVDGIELCRAVRQADLCGYTYIIMLTGLDGRRQRLEGLSAGADDFLSKPLETEEMTVCLKTAERILSLETRDVALFAMAKLAESRDTETGAHVERVQSYTRAIATQLSPEFAAHYRVDGEFIRLLHQTSPLHDIGKVGIPDAILLKPGNLTAEEFAIMKTHTVIGAETLDAALRRFPHARFLEMARDVALTHHERYDGNGYPKGLSGEQIPLCGRIVAVADVYDGLSSRRVYKEGMSHEKAKEIIVAERGKHFDPGIVDAFLRAEEQIVAIRERLRDETGLAEVLGLPTPATLADAPHAGAPHAAAHPPRQCKILVVEDNALVRRKVVSVLAAIGEPVITACDGQEAMAVIERERPQLVLSDWEMPNVDGIQLCKWLRANPDTSHIHFIILTAHAERGRILEAYDVGVDDFVSKPFDVDEFLVRVRAGLRATRLLTEASRKVAGSQAINAQLASVNRRLERLSVTDELTGLFNRRYGVSRLQDQWAAARRDGTPLSVALIDVDNFKKINDTHGHDNGDLILRRVATVLQDTTRASDTLCRFGGEEFLVVFPNGRPVEARSGAERMRAAIASRAGVKTPVEISPTISVGVATITDEMTDFADLLKHADRALYAAKAGGRNVVVSFESLSQGPAMNSEPDRPAQAPPVDVNLILRRCSGDAQFASAVTLRFRRHAGAEVDKLVAAFAANDVPAAQRTAHGLKSMLAYMGVEGAAEMAKNVEGLCREGRADAARELIGPLGNAVRAAVDWLGANEGAALGRVA